MAEEKKYKEVEQNFWMPEKTGDFVCGIYEGMMENVGENESNVYKIRQEDDKLVFVWATAVLDTKMQLVKFGNDIKIVYLGDKKAQGGKRTYKDFQIFRAEQEETADEDANYF